MQFAPSTLRWAAALLQLWPGRVLAAPKAGPIIATAAEAAVAVLAQAAATNSLLSSTQASGQPSTEACVAAYQLLAQLVLHLNQYANPMEEDGTCPEQPPTVASLLSNTALMLQLCNWVLIAACSQLVQGVPEPANCQLPQTPHQAVASSSGSSSSTGTEPGSLQQQAEGLLLQHAEQLAAAVAGTHQPSALQQSASAAFLLRCLKGSILKQQALLGLPDSFLSAMSTAASAFTSQTSSSSSIQHSGADSASQGESATAAAAQDALLQRNLLSLRLLTASGRLILHVVDFGAASVATSAHSVLLQSLEILPELLVCSFGAINTLRVVPATSSAASDAAASVFNAAATLISQSAEYECCTASGSVGLQLSAGSPTTAGNLLVSVATAAAGPTHGGMRLMAQTVHATVQLLQMTAAAAAAAAAAAGTNSAAAAAAEVNISRWTLTVEPCTRLLAALLDSQLHTTADGSSTQQQLLQLSYAVLVLEAGIRNTLSALRGMLRPEWATTTSAVSTVSSSSRLQPRPPQLATTNSLTPSVRLMDLILDSFTLWLVSVVESGCGALLCKALSADADQQSLLIDSLHGQALLQALLSLHLTNSKVRNSYSTGFSEHSLLPALLMLATTQCPSANKPAASAGNSSSGGSGGGGGGSSSRTSGGGSSSNGGNGRGSSSSSSRISLQAVGWAEPLQMAGISLIARLLLTSATYLATYQSDQHRWTVGSYWMITNILQLAPTVLDSSTSSAVQQLQQQAQQFGISNVVTLSGQLELVRVYLCANSSSSSCQKQLVGGGRAVASPAYTQA
jgi:hypothetical protein